MPAGGSSRRERDVIAAIRSRLPVAPPGETWIGDDAAVLRGPTGQLVLSSDLVVAGVHADLEVVGLDDLGWKAVAVNVSDVAAMGCTPLHCVVSIAAPSHLDLDLLFDGIVQSSEVHGCAVVGGDLSNAECLVAAVTITGDSGPSSPVLRSGASAGDAVFVTGPLGASAAGLRALRAREASHPCIPSHLRPVARVVEGAAAGLAGATAMIDVSDGLASDADQIATASGVGLGLAGVPVAEGSTIEEALYGGEDYELVFTAPDRRRVSDIFAAKGLRQPVVIGSCTEDPGERSLDGTRLREGGWEHRWGGPRAGRGGV
jgi:thiamine-monophosphate kinase